VDAVALRPRAFVRVVGPDAEDYLQRMLSNDVAVLASSESCEALLLTPKARVIAPMRVLRLGDDDFLLLTEPREGIATEEIRAAVLEMSAKPHTGCSKFSLFTRNESGPWTVELQRRWNHFESNEPSIYISPKRVEVDLLGLEYISGTYFKTPFTGRAVGVSYWYGMLLGIRHSSRYARSCGPSALRSERHAPETRTSPRWTSLRPASRSFPYRSTKRERLLAPAAGA
jgi:hypothetical protein